MGTIFGPPDDLSGDPNMVQGQGLASNLLYLAILMKHLDPVSIHYASKRTPRWPETAPRWPKRVLR